MKEQFQRQQTISPIDQEIDWHERHRGTSGKSNTFEDGFIEGLRHAASLPAPQPAAPDGDDISPELWLIINERARSLQAFRHGHISHTEISCALLAAIRAARELDRVAPFRSTEQHGGRK